MTFKGFTPIFSVDDMELSVRFYVDVLGFTCDMQSPGFSNLHRDAVRIMLAAPNAHVPWDGPRFTGQIYIGLENPAEVDALWDELNGKVEAVYPPDDFDYGAHEFGIRDCNGYRLSFGAPTVAS